ncbi:MULTISPECIES: RagB/SusD family nutrient uptake outer membrane protein [unclassified Saccharicrinis]|uniref:RagB/SusD family nutrient uptake outer membrane protein n=1 Tax=unclassified Saccharicrinis TaxID=2646859 RepID=UPI003D32C847
MKHIIRKYNILFLALICIVAILPLGGCDDFLTEEPVGTVNESILTNEEGIETLLIATYAAVDGYMQGESPSGSTGGASPMNWIWGDVASDDIHRGDNPGGWSGITDVEMFQVQTTNLWTKECWGVHYEGIARANDVLRILSLASDNIEASKASNIAAQAKFLRAWFYYQLRLKFKNIPYITENDDPINVKNDVEVWDHIEADLEAAIPDLETDLTEKGRASQWAAKALLARVHMFQEEWSEAAPLLDDIIDNGSFQLEDHFYNNFDEDYQNNGESIFEIQYSVNDGAGVHNSGIDHQTLYPVGPIVGLGYSYSAPTFDLFNAYKVGADGLPMLDTYNDNLLLEDYGVAFNEPFTPTNHLLDPRVDWTIARRGVPFLDWGPMWGSNWMSNQAAMGPFLNKKVLWYKRNKGIISSTTGYWARGVNGNNYRALRLGHVIIWRAEVAVEQNQLDVARDLINQIRSRAADDILMGKVMNDTFGSDVDLVIDETQPAANYMLGLYPSFPSQDYARKAVQFETRLEFALEGLRFFDLRRWGIVGQVMNSYLANETANGRIPWLAGAAFVENKNEYWPLPQDQVDLQPGVLFQDPAY